MEATITRKTAETDLSLTLNPLGKGRHIINTGIGFFNHMLELFAAHGRFDLAVDCKGDIQVDYHHTVEDIGIALGQAFAKALGDKRGIARYGHILLPMDEALVQVALDCSGRAHLSLALEEAADNPCVFPAELVEEFLLALTREMGLTLHIRQLAGRNAHHIIEAVFKGLGRALGAAVAPDPARAGEIPSTKGVL